MDLKPQSQQPISDDQELAKVLAGVTEEADQSAAAGSGTTPADPVAPALPPLPDPATMPPAPVAAAPAMPTMMTTPVTSASGLDSVKQDAIRELRPLVDKLNVSPEEKFDTYLLLLRSTDDQTLVAPAHEAAKQITDETKRADALLNIIKEIDYLSNPQGQ